MSLEEKQDIITNKELRRLPPTVEGHSINIFRIIFVLFKWRNKVISKKIALVGNSSFVTYVV